MHRMYVHIFIIHAYLIGHTYIVHHVVHMYSTHTHIHISITTNSSWINVGIHIYSILTKQTLRLMYIL